MVLIQHNAFEWDSFKENGNITKHGMNFEEAASAFLDPFGVLIFDNKHSSTENRWFFIGKTRRGIATIRLTFRNNKIRILGAGYWRNGVKRYEKENAKE